MRWPNRLSVSQRSKRTLQGIDLSKNSYGEKNIHKRMDLTILVFSFTKCYGQPGTFVKAKPTTLFFVLSTFHRRFQPTTVSTHDLPYLDLGCPKLVDDPLDTHNIALPRKCTDVVCKRRHVSTVRGASASAHFFKAGAECGKPQHGERPWLMDKCYML